MSDPDSAIFDCSILIDVGSRSITVKYKKIYFSYTKHTLTGHRFLCMLSHENSTLNNQKPFKLGMERPKEALIDFIFLSTRRQIVGRFLLQISVTFIKMGRGWG